MKAKGILVIGVIVAVVIGVAIMSQKEIAPQIADTVEPSDQVKVELGNTATDTIVPLDNALINELKNGTNYYYDQNGTKHYVLEAIDSPVIGD